MLRVYYWLSGAPADRPGGPWWMRDFQNPKRGYEFMEGIKKISHKILYQEGAFQPVDHNNLVPPDDFQTF